MSTTQRDLTSHLEAWDGEAVIVRFDASTGAWIFIALHDTTLGRPTGGTRMRIYDSPGEGLQDAQRLAAGMTAKWAALGFEKGGGKAVLALSRPLEGEEWRGLLLRYGDLLESLRGAFGTGEDLGTTPEDMRIIAERTRFVHGVTDSGRKVEDPGPFTARGVVAGIRAALRHVIGEKSLVGTTVAGKTVLIQGVGDVGEPIARDLAPLGAKLLLSDLDTARVETLAQELGAEIVAPDAVYSTPCDVFAPCAIGAILNTRTIPQLACRIVAGSANNQLETPGDAQRLLERGILYAPDYIINGAGALAFGLMEQGVTDREVLMARVEQVGDTLQGIFQEAEERQESPLEVSKRLVERALAAGRKST